MNREKFCALLKKNGIDSNMVSFQDDTKEGFCVRKNDFRWETLVRERGKEYEVVGHPSESDALIRLARELLLTYDPDSTDRSEE